MIPFTNILLVSGTGRNVGKTTFCLNVLNHFSKSFPIISIKVSPHFHFVDQEQEFFYKTNEYWIIEENDKNKQKDSCLMLQAGAKSSFFIMCKDEFVFEAFNKVIELFHPNQAFIIESGGLDKFIKAGVQIVLTTSSIDEAKASSKNRLQNADLLVNYHLQSFESVLDKISFFENNWRLKNSQ